MDEALLRPVSRRRPRPGVGWSALRARFRAVALFVLEDLEHLECGLLARDELAQVLQMRSRLQTRPWRSRRERRQRRGHDRPGPSRLVNRLLGGLVVRIASARTHITTALRPPACQPARADIQAEAVEMLAQSADGYRTLDGWLARLALEVRLKHQKPGKEQARPHANRFLTTTRCPRVSPGRLHSIPADGRFRPAEETALAEPMVTIDAIVRAVADRFGVRLSRAAGSSRRALGRR